MKDLLDKIGSYNIFNYLLPGVLFAVFIDRTTPLKLLGMNAAVVAFVCYFLGSVVSRVGSLAVEPAMRKLGLVTFEPYENFVRAVKTDPQLEVLSETNNMYRTFCGLLLSIAFVGGFEFASGYWPILCRAAPGIVVAGLFLRFCKPCVICSESDSRQRLDRMFRGTVRARLAFRGRVAQSRHG
jgi:hypothetical protein